MRGFGASGVRGYLSGLGAVIIAFGAGGISLSVNPPSDGRGDLIRQPGARPWWTAVAVAGFALVLIVALLPVLYSTVAVTVAAGPGGRTVARTHGPLR